MTIQDAYKFLVEDYAYATEESKEALRTIMFAYEHLFNESLANYKRNVRRKNPRLTPEETAKMKEMFMERYKVDITILFLMDKED